MTIYLVTEDTTYEEQLISGKHFGVNLVTIYDEEFVDPTDELRTNVQQLGATALRFPGGSATENYFDMRTPNATVFTRDPSQTLTPMDAFFATAGEIGVAVTIVIPTQMAFDLSAAEAMLAGTFGDRNQVTAEYLQDVATFVATAVAYADATGVQIEAFEIGNEFWGSGEMSAAEYGIVAGEVAALLDSELDTLGMADAEIIAQTTGSASKLYSPRDPVDAYVGYVDGVARAFTQDDIDSQYGGIVPEGWQAVVVDGQGSARSQVTQIANGINSVPGAADAIDGLVQHYYQSGGFEKADGTKSFKFSQFQRLEDKLERSEGSAEMTYHITEWNTNATGAANNRGLQNASMMVENFFELVANDVDAAQIWPLSFDSAQGISLVDLDGPDLAISGEMFRLMSESLPESMPVLDWSVTGVIDVHGFAKDTGAVFFVSERSGVGQTGVQLDLAQFLTGQTYFMTSTQLWDGGAGGDDATALPVLTDVDGAMSDDVILAFDLDSWANRRIEVTYVGDGADNLVGRGGADTIEAFGGDDIIDAGGGDDVILGGAGADAIDGGSGEDTVVLDGETTEFTVIYDAWTGAQGTLKLMGPGGDVDTLTRIETLAFVDQSLTTERVVAYLQQTRGAIGEGSAESHSVAVSEIAASPDPTVAPQVQMEVGRTSIEQIDSGFWKSVSFAQAIEDAAVIMGPASSEGGQPFTIRVRNVTDMGFEFQVDEWDYLDGYHGEIQVSWLAGTKGSHQLADGSTMHLGQVDTTSLGRNTVDLTGFETAPIIFGQLAGDAEASSIAHRIDDVTVDAFDFQVQLEEASAGLRSSIAQSTFYYAAVDVEQESFLFERGAMATDHIYKGIGATLEASEGFFADMQTIAGRDPGVVRYHRDADGAMSLRIQEEKSKDREKHHAHEDVAWVFLEQGVYELV